MRSRGLIVTIDGPSGAGKSTLSRLLARRLDYLYLDTGAMYRSVALAARRRGIEPEDVAALERLLSQLEIGFETLRDGQRVLLDGEDVSAAIRAPEISLLTARFAAVPVVRQALVKQQQRIGAAGGVVVEGRDIGSVVFPDAEVKLFLTASAAERGRRRFEELRAGGGDVSLEQTVAEVEARDRADMERLHAPLVRPDDALDIDSDHRSVEEVLALMLDAVAAASPAGN